MARCVTMVGIDPAELRWLRMLVQLLRHPDPGTPELARQALLYLSEAGERHADAENQSLDYAG